MTLLTLIKKEVIQFFRNKSAVVVMLIFPIVLILVLGSALNGLMSIDRNIFKNKTIYYCTNELENNKELKIFYNFITAFEKDTDVNFISIDNKKKAIKNVNNNEAICFIDISNDNYNYYRNENRESSESKIFRNIYEQYLKKYTLLNSMKKSNPKKLSNLLSKEVRILLQNEGIGKEEINSFAYYTFAELVLIILYISSLTSTSMYKEKYLNTMTRMKISKANKLEIIVSKIAMGIIVGILQIIIVYFISSVFFKVNWGDNLLDIFNVLICLVIFSSVFGIFISIICTDEKTCYTLSNVLLIIMGFLGGAYVPICLVKSVGITSFLCNVIPTYWANISLISLSYGIDSYYHYISIFISLSLSVILLTIGLIISKLKVGGSFD